MYNDDNAQTQQPVDAEAETIQSLISAVSTPVKDRSLASPDVTSLQSSWSAEKQALLEAIKSYKNLVVQAGKASSVRN